MQHTLGDLANMLGLSYRGDADRLLDGLAPLGRAGPQHLSFVASKRFLASAVASDAGAIIVPEAWAAQIHQDCLYAEQPYLAFARATHFFDDRPQPSGGIHPTANVHPEASVADRVTIDAGAVVEAGAQLGEGVWIGANVVVGRRVCVGAGTQMRPGVVVYHDVIVGENCLIHSNTVIGADGFGFAPDEGRWHKILQLGRVVIGNRVEIGASTTIDRGALDDTIIGDDVIIDNQVHIAHNVTIGRGTAMAASVGVAGSTKIGAGCTIAGQAGLADHIEIADGVHIGGQARVTRSITEPGHYTSGTTVQPLRQWAKNALRFEQLNSLAQRVADLEARLGISGHTSGEGEQPES